MTQRNHNLTWINEFSVQIRLLIVFLLEAATVTIYQNQ